MKTIITDNHIILKENHNTKILTYTDIYNGNHIILKEKQNVP